MNEIIPSSTIAPSPVDQMREASKVRFLEFFLPPMTVVNGQSSCTEHGKEGSKLPFDTSGNFGS